MGRIQRSFVLGIACCLAAPGAFGLDAATSLRQPNPGARSMGLGGAFAAQADDATAAFANPAGLTQLLSPELSTEIRLFVFTGDSPGDDTVIDLSTVSFFSGVYPIGRWSIALYRNQQAKVDLGTTYSETSKMALPGLTRTNFSFVLNAFEITSYGLSGAYRVSEKLSLGLGVAFHEGSLSGTSEQTSFNDNADDWGMTGGLLWAPHRLWSVGAFYRQGPDLTFGLTFGTPFPIPDTAGAGVAFQSPGGGLTINLEWDRLRYSNTHGAPMNGGTVRFDDADEIHLGAEYAFLNANPIIAIRAGVWTDPARRWLESDQGLEALDDDELHYAVGMGFAWQSFKLDFAIDYSTPVITSSVSGIYTF